MADSSAVLAGTVPQVEEHVAQLESLVEVHELHELERHGKARAGVFRALERRELELLQEPRRDRYRVRRGVSLGGVWCTPHTPERLRNLAPHVLAEGLRSGVIERVNE